MGTSDKDAHIDKLAKENAECLRIILCYRLDGKCQMRNLKMTVKLSLVLCSLLVAMPGKTCRAKTRADTEESPRIVNIINFIRQCEPRIDWITEDVLYETVVEQVDIMKRYQKPKVVGSSNVHPC